MSKPKAGDEGSLGLLDWDRYQASLRGLRAISVSGAVGAGILLAADLALFQYERPADALPGPFARAALAFGMLVAVAIGATTLTRRGEVSRPLVRAGALTLLLICVGALAAAAAGGFEGYYPFGLLPLLMVWTATMPSGSSAAAFPLLGGLTLHLLVLRLTGSGAWGPRGVATMVMLMILAGSGVVLAGVLERARRQRTAASRLDPLTGILHRQGLLQELKLLCSRRLRQEGAISLVLFDLDRFRLLNAAHGRTFGDQVLEMMGALVRNSVRAHDLVGRYGPDEFMLVLDGCDGDQAVQLIERLRAQLAERPIPVGQETARVTLSAGVIFAPPGSTPTAEELMHAAERALAESKNAQLNRTVLGPATGGPSLNGEGASTESQIPPAVVWNFPPPPALEPKEAAPQQELAAVATEGTPPLLR